MTQEDKELLLKDLCARLPYGVIVKQGCYEGKLTSFDKYTLSFNSSCALPKPYLRSMSSMTEEEEKEYRNIDNRSYPCPIYYAHIPASNRIDWLIAHHFDYRGLIEKGLAIEVTEENNPYESIHK